jgi:chloramphenicol-sensitive protein RarD
LTLSSFINAVFYTVSENKNQSPTLGIITALCAYVIWGLFPLFWKHLHSVDALELIAHRIVWSFVFVTPIVAVFHGFKEFKSVYTNFRAVIINLLTGLMLSSNWLIYVWAVNAGHIVESSLGYFIVPLLNATVGYLILKEHLRVNQWIAIGIAAVGVFVLVFEYGHLPWVALGLALTWGMYGLLRKKSTLSPLPGLAIETSLLAPFAIVFLIWKSHQGLGALGHSDLTTHILVFCTGIVTSIPLVLFANAAKHLKLSTLGLLQYLTPTSNLLLGVFLYNENFSREKLMSFSLIWIALTLYSLDSILVNRNQTKA